MALDPIVSLTVTTVFAVLAGIPAVWHYWRVPDSQRERHLRRVREDVIHFIVEHPDCWPMDVERGVKRNSADIRQILRMLTSGPHPVIQAKHVGKGTKLRLSSSSKTTNTNEQSTRDGATQGET